jgi:hypothetical protein
VLLGCHPELHNGLPDKSCGSASPRFSRQRPIRAASSLPMMIRASEPPMKERLFWIILSIPSTNSAIPVLEYPIRCLRDWILWLSPAS